MATLDLSQIASLASNVYAYRMTFVATLAALTYDYLLTIGHEKDLIWPSRVSVVKILFLLNRYVPFVGISVNIYVLISLDIRAHLRNCIPAFWAAGIFITAEYILAELVLYTRAYAIWGRTRTALVMIMVIILVVFTPGVYFASTTLKSATLIDLPVFPTGCLISLDGHTEMLAMISVVISEAVALLAVLVKAAQMPQSTIMKQISSNGVLFFVVILCITVTVANIIVLNVVSPELCNLLLSPQAAVHSICCNRLILQTKCAPAQMQHLHVIVSSSHQVLLRPHAKHNDDIEMQSL